ncbi:hypothetical protein LI187_13385, partial [bacterium 210820-DFI.6.38]|nr:hypothetical protein [bacterium 210820-DFI.6.38]
ISRKGIFISKNSPFSAKNQLAILSYNNRSILECLSKIKFWSRILSHTVNELFRSFLYKKSRNPLKTEAFGVVSWRP